MRYLNEFIGTFFLVLTVGMSLLNTDNIALAPLAIGSILMVMIFAGAHISGGHYNPAVSLAVFFRKKINGTDLCWYWVTQFLAGLIAALITLYFKDSPTPGPLTLHPGKALIAEFLFAFALCYVVLNVATIKETGGNSYFGLAIGFTVLAGSYAVGAISGAAFNPAVALGITILGFTVWSNLWIYLVANLLGGILAASVVNAFHGKQKKISF